jgi:hypothetical protein
LGADDKRCVIVCHGEGSLFDVDNICEKKKDEAGFSLILGSFTSLLRL